MVLGHDGMVNITGTIQDNTCEVAPDSESMAVDMGTVAREQFSEVGDTSPAKPFSIMLKNCGPAASEATVTFSGTSDPQNNTLYALESGEDAASGLALAIFGSNGAIIPPDSASSGFQLSPGQTSVTMNFSAKYESVTQPVSAGKANTVVSFVVKYN
ncbi:fimbrial protein [Enterobacter sp. 118C5]|uniref:fimbrial protein n=1 Tax=Enterobacter TaxID=547 RepID=UPI002A80C2CA|nr:fimbrial protein [Enterobacter sp. 118C5]